ISIDAIVEERKVVTQTRRKKRIDHFLHPIISINSPPPARPAKPTSSISSIHTYLNKVKFIGWFSPQQKWEDWVKTMKVAHSPGWKMAGIHDAIMNSTLKIPQNKCLIFWFAEKWSPKTNTFILPWGEITITLEDMMVLGGLSLLGGRVTSNVESPHDCDALSQLNNVYIRFIKSPSKKASSNAWMTEFKNNQNVHEHEAFIVLWLSKYLFPSVKDTVLPDTFAFPCVRPDHGMPDIRDDETRLARWAKLVHKSTYYATLESDDFKSINTTFHPPPPPPALPPPNPPPPPLLTTEPTTITTTCPPAEFTSGPNRVHNRPKMSSDVVRSHDGDGGGEDRPLHTMYPAVAWVALLTEPNLGGRAAGRLNTREKTQNLSLKEITDTKGPVPIQFELRDKQTVMPLGDHAAHWSSYIGETQFDLRPHMESPDWTEINASIQQHLQKVRERPENITASEYDKYIEFWNDPRNIVSAAQNRKNRAKSTVISRQGSWSLARLRDEMM
nr:hypothetical protein [Tanacetum cinerariifolium]